VTVVLLAGTQAGVHVIEEDRTLDIGGPVSALAYGDEGWIAADDHRVHISPDGLRWDQVATIPDLEIRCVLPTAGDTYLGTSEAHLYRLRDSAAEPIEEFEDIEGRQTWHTPWGGPPDTRSLSRANDGALYANVHVGGIPTSSDGGRTWSPTIEVDADVHQVLAHDDLVLAACAPGLALSSDGGRTWRMDADGLHAHYCRAVAVSGDTVLVSASTGPFTKQAAVYRRPLRSTGAFEKCAGGLPEWFVANVDTHCLVAVDDRVAIGTDEGEIWLSEDQGSRWERAVNGLGSISCLAFGDVGV
jgi:hypothetical protein